MRLDEAADITSPVNSMDVTELVDHVRVAARQIEQEGSLGRVEVADRVYVKETTLHSGRWRDPLTRQPPRRLMGPELAELIRHPEPNARHYLCIVVAEPDRHDQVLLTVAIHVRRDGPTLTIETNQFVYFPLKPQYRQLDQAPAHAGRRLLGRLDRVIGAPGALPAAARDLARDLGRTAHHLGRVLLAHLSVADRSLLEERQVFDLRSYVADDTMTHTEQADVWRCQHVVEAAMLGAIERFLEDHNISTASLMRKQAQVFNLTNNGVIAEEVYGYNMPVGQGASVSLSADAAPAPTPA